MGQEGRPKARHERGGGGGEIFMGPPRRAGRRASRPQVKEFIWSTARRPLTYSIHRNRCNSARAMRPPQPLDMWGPKAHMTHCYDADISRKSCGVMAQFSFFLHIVIHINCTCIRYWYLILLNLLTESDADPCLRLEFGLVIWQSSTMQYFHVPM